MSTIPYTCTGQENAGDAELFDAQGEHFTTIFASRCFADWYCASNGWTWRWRNGVDPDDPTTWPAPQESEPQDPSPTP
ncbi:hypothetical protein FHW58_003398 [Duganella sp. 1224]|uniref:hypothetical protein n=1 Tax=Duganella sp. 1224 TaxID=2587052 RepID=UPI0015C7C740|nr:hypothetical protein [Duganella sp. 1224]NYE62183.1 hypothetical protein [Duganella sp. 1224]